MASENESESPLTLHHIQTALENQGKIIQQLDQNNSKDVCSYILKLNLQFQGIGSLHLAWLLTNIEELYLSNNILTSADGLQSLHKLKWLDLSFNKIKSTKDLRSLTNLEVLALHENHVTEIDREICINFKKLKVLSLGNNRIANKSDILLLRRLPKLGSLTIRNNPCNEEDYPSYVIAHIPNLVYVDYNRITDESREKACKSYKESLSSVKKENEYARKTSVHRSNKQREEERHKMAGVYALNDDTLFKKLFENDIEMNAMMYQHGVQSIIQRFGEEFKGICFQVFEEGLIHAEQRQKEIKLLQIALQDAKDASNRIARKEVSVLDADMEKLLLKVIDLNIDEESTISTEDTEHYDARESKAQELRETIEEVLDSALMKLFENEVGLANEMKEVLELAEDELGMMVTYFLSDTSEHFEEGRRYAYSFYCKLREITSKLADANVAVTTRESSQKTLNDSKRVVDIPQSTSDDIFEGGDTLTAALARIHDRHLEIINSREKELKDHLKLWLQQTLEEFYRVEWKRHRILLEEISTLADEKRKEFETSLPVDFR